MRIKTVPCPSVQRVRQQLNHAAAGDAHRPLHIIIIIIIIIFVIIILFAQ